MTNNEFTSHDLATALRRAHAIHKASYDPSSCIYQKGLRISSAEAANGNLSLELILACLLTANYREIWDACDLILGPE